jgi:hypothetical protein
MRTDFLGLCVMWLEMSTILSPVNTIGLPDFCMPLTEPFDLNFLINCRSVSRCGTSVSENRSTTFRLTSSKYFPPQRNNVSPWVLGSPMTTSLFTLLYTDHWLTCDWWRIAKIWSESVGEEVRWNHIPHCWRFMGTDAGTIKCNTLFSQVHKNFTGTLHFQILRKHNTKYIG